MLFNSLLAACLVIQVYAQCGDLTTTLTNGQTYSCGCGTTAFLRYQGFAFPTVTVGPGCVADAYLGGVTMRGGVASLAGGVGTFDQGNGGIVSILGASAQCVVAAGATGYIEANLGSAITIYGTAVVNRPAPSANTPTITVAGGAAVATVLGTNVRALVSGAGARFYGAGPSMTVTVTDGATATLSGAQNSIFCNGGGATIYALEASASAASGCIAIGLGIGPSITLAAQATGILDERATGGFMDGDGAIMTLGGNGSPGNIGILSNIAEAPGVTALVQSGNAYLSGDNGGFTASVQGGASRVVLPSGATATVDIGGQVTADPAAQVTPGPGAVLSTISTNTDGNRVVTARAASVSQRRRREPAARGCQSPMLSCPNARGDGRVCRLPSEKLEYCGGCDGHSGQDCTALFTEEDNVNVACRQGRCVVI